MVGHAFDLEMEGCHAFDETPGHEIVTVCTDLGAFALSRHPPIVRTVRRNVGTLRSNRETDMIHGYPCGSPLASLGDSGFRIGGPSKTVRNDRKDLAFDQFACPVEGTAVDFCHPLSALRPSDGSVISCRDAQATRVSTGTRSISSSRSRVRAMS